MQCRPRSRPATGSSTPPTPTATRTASAGACARAASRARSCSSRRSSTREWHGVREVREAFVDSTRKLGVEYLDLYLIHWPNPGQDRFVDAWRGLCHLLDEGLVRAIGVSNFKPAHLERLLESTGVAPDVNQIELNPYARPDGAARVPCAARDRDAVLQPDRQGWRAAARAGRRRRGRAPGPHARAGRAALARPAGADGRGEVIGSRAPGGEPGRVRLRARPRRRWRALSALDRGEAAATDSDTFGH